MTKGRKIRGPIPSSPPCSLPVFLIASISGKFLHLGSLGQGIISASQVDSSYMVQASQNRGNVQWLPRAEMEIGPEGLKQDDT